MRRYILAAVATVLLAAPQLVLAQPQPVGAPPVVAQVAIDGPLGYGATLPPAWRTAQYFIADPDRFDLPRPAAGFGWSHYYDDVLLTDRWGRVYDSRPYAARGYERRHHRRHRDRDYVDDDRNDRPHWDADYVAAAPADIVTTTTTRSCKPVVTRRVSYFRVAARPQRRLKSSPLKARPLS